MPLAGHGSMNGKFEQVAETVTIRTADLLGTEVCVTNDRGQVIASSVSTRVGRALEESTSSTEWTRVPIRVDSREGEVVVAGQPSGEAFSPRLARAFVELVLSQAMEVDRFPNPHQLKNKFIYDLLHSKFDDEAAILRQGQILGMDFVPPRLVILIDAADYILVAPAGAAPDDSGVRLRAQVVIDSVVDFFELPSDTICAYLGDGEVAVLKASNRRNLNRWVRDRAGSDPANRSWADLQALKRAGEALLARLRSATVAQVTIGIGRHHPGLRGLARSYQDAQAALSLGRRFQGPNGVHCLDSLGIASFVGLADEQTKVDLARYVLSPLDGQTDLMTTLESFFAHDCKPLPTARALYVHRNTLTYRLDKITSLIGLDPRRFDDAVQIRLSLVLRSFLPDVDATGHPPNSSG
jgi:carbohydrate diacid regulator